MRIAPILAPGLALLLSASTASAVTYFVIPDGTGDYPTIQAAIDAASNGDVLELADAVFTGKGNRNIDCRGKTITIRSRSGDPRTCIIDCENAGRAFYFHSNEGSTTVVEAITIKHGWIWGQRRYGGAILCDSASPTIRDCVITCNRAIRSGGAICCFRSSAKIIRCTITANDANDSGGAVFCDHSSSPTLSHCVITGNHACHGGAMCLDGSSAEVISCTISGCSPEDDGGGIVCYRSHISFYNSILWGNAAVEAFVDVHSTISFSCCDVDTSGIVGFGTMKLLGGNIFSDPLFCDPGDSTWCATLEGDYHLSRGSPCAPGNTAPRCDLIGALGVRCSGHLAWEPADLLTSISPNPFRPQARVTYMIPPGGAMPVKLTVYDAIGRRVRTLHDDVQPAGTHSVLWDGTNSSHERVAPGVYFVRLTAQGRSETKRVVMLK